MGQHHNDDPGVIKYFTGRIMAKGFTEVLYGFTDAGSWATAKHGSRYFTVTTDGTDALRQLNILLKDMKSLEDE